MPNTSATGGYLVPAAPAVEGDALENFIHDVVAGVTGLDGDRVRPRWQPEPPDLPDGYWCAFGVMRRVADFNAYARHDPDGDGADQIERHENLEILCSFYGPTSLAELYAEYWRDGLQVSQNREQLQLAKWGLIETMDVTPAPSLVKERWLYRADITTRFRRLITNVYPVLNLVSAAATLYTDVPPVTTPILVTDPPTP